MMNRSDAYEQQFEGRQNGDVLVKPYRSTSEPDSGDLLAFPKSRTGSDKSVTISFSSSHSGKNNGEQNMNNSRSTFGAKLPVILCILLTEMSERLVYYGVVANLLVFLTGKPMSIDSAHASSIVLIFTGVGYVIPIFGGWVADSLCGKYNALYGSILIYFLGTAMLPVLAYDYSHFGPEYGFNTAGKWVFFVLSMLFIAIGTGGIKACVSPFGADQVQSLGPAAISAFFNWFYWFINVGSFVAFTLIVYVQTNYGFFKGYLILTGAILLAAFFLISGRNKYICKPPNGSIITDIIKIMHKATQRRRRLTRAPEYRKVDGMGWLDYARVRYGGPYLDGQVDSVLALMRILPIIACMIIYWTVYLQIQTSYLLQGLGMDLRVTGDFRIPPASLGIFDIIIILLLVPTMDRFVYRGLRKLNVNLSPLRKMGFGMILAGLSLIIAAILEVRRRNEYSGKIVTISGKNYKQSDMTIFYQVPQFLLIGISEVFTVIAGLEFSYAQSPKVLQGVVMGIFLMSTGLGSFFGSALIQIVNAVSCKISNVNWYNGDDINEGKLDFFFYILATLLGINFLVFCAIAARYTYISEATLTRDEEDWGRRAVTSPIASIDDYIDSNEYSEN